MRWHTAHLINKHRNHILGKIISFQDILFITALLFAPAAMGNKHSLGATASRPGGGGLTIVAPPSLTAISSEYDIANFKYYGPQDSIVVSGPAVVLDGRALCEPDESVRGVIVIIGDWFCGAPPLVSSRMDNLYEKHQEQGALALVLVTKSSLYPPGNTYACSFFCSCICTCKLVCCSDDIKTLLLSDSLTADWHSK